MCQRQVGDSSFIKNTAKGTVATIRNVRQNIAKIFQKITVKSVLGRSSTESQRQLGDFFQFKILPKGQYQKFGPFGKESKKSAKTYGESGFKKF